MEYQYRLKTLPFGMTEKWDHRNEILAMQLPCKVKSKKREAERFNGIREPTLTPNL